jgi:hypothetical protein
MTPIKTEQTKNLVKTLYRFTNDYGANVLYFKETGFCQVIPLQFTGTNKARVMNVNVIKLKDLTPKEMTEVLHMIEELPSED